MGLIIGLVANRWPGNCAPYFYEKGQLTPSEITNINTAVSNLNATGLVRLIWRAAQTRYIQVVPDYQPLDGICWSSHTGMSAGRQEVKLDPNAGVGVIMHEFLHALGVSHEHKRPDRDDFVGVNYRVMNISRRADFDKAAAPAAVIVGPYDLDSIMHIRDVAASGAIGAIRDNRDWSSDWTTALPYARGPQACLLLYKRSSGLLRLHTLAANGTVGPMFEESALPPGTGAIGDDWTSIKHYRIGSSDYLFFLRKSTGEMMVHGVGYNGGLGQRIQFADWSSDWTSAEPFTTPNGTFLFLLKTSDGKVHVNRIEDDGSIGPIVDQRNFGAGWTSGAVIQRGANAALVLIKA